MLKKIIFISLLFLSTSGFAQDLTNAYLNSLNLYDKGVTNYKKNKFKIAASYFTSSVEEYPNVDAYYNLALVKLKLGDTCRYCHNLKKASMMGDTAAGRYYNKFCSFRADELLNFYKTSDSSISAAIKANPSANAYLDMAITQGKLGDKCAFCKSLESDKLSNFPSIRTVIFNNCHSIQNIIIQDTTHMRNGIYNTIYTETCTNKKQYTFLEQTASGKEILKYKTSEIQSGRIMSIDIKKISSDFSEYTLNIDTTKLGTDDMSLYVQKIVKVSTPSDPVLTIVELMPGYDGGEEAMYYWLSNNIKYPQEAKETGVQGTVVVTFVVEKDGSHTGVQILKGIGGGCDEEAVRVINAMPKWKPGKQNGELVRVQFNIPIRFTLE